MQWLIVADPDDARLGDRAYKDGMKVLRYALVVLLASLWIGTAQGQAPAESGEGAKPKVYALVGAVGNEMGWVTETPTTGTHLAPYRRTTVEVPNNLLNRFVLSSLDTAIGRIDPASRRVYLSLARAPAADLPATQREGAAIAAVVAALEPMPQRADWDRIVVVTATYGPVDIAGLPAKLLGPGVFVEPICQGRMGKGPVDSDSCSTNWQPPAGPEALTPGGRVIRANFYTAPYAYLRVWVLDPRTLAVLDQHQVFDSQKLADPDSGLRGAISADFLAAGFSRVLEGSVQEAVLGTVLRGKVEAGEVRKVDPDDARR